MIEYSPSPYQILVTDASGVITFLPNGTPGYVLTATSGQPEWVQIGFDFNGKVDKFLFHPNMSGHGGYQELHYEAKIDIQP